ncbi:hypothetical protein QUB68_26145 [Microcoleus sp. A006_D1]|uniref:hypothetical protein n=1 Tax=Microcoleus sp. A006_D1 TaxID=3055267 RepID=UPI002FCF8B65
MNIFSGERSAKADRPIRSYLSKFTRSHWRENRLFLYNKSGQQTKEEDFTCKNAHKL